MWRILYEGSTFLMGERRVVSFWLHDWVDAGPLCGLFLRIFRVVSNRKSIIFDCYKVRNSCILWGVSFRRWLCPSKEAQYEELFSILSNIFFCKNFKDSCIWKDSIFREFSLKAF